MTEYDYWIKTTPRNAAVKYLASNQREAEEVIQRQVAYGKCWSVTAPEVCQKTE